MRKPSGISSTTMVMFQQHNTYGNQLYKTCSKITFAIFLLKIVSKILIPATHHYFCNLTLRQWLKLSLISGPTPQSLLLIKLTSH